MKKLTIERAYELLDYEPSTGLFKWKVTRGPCNPGDVAGNNKNTNLYITICIDGIHYLAHRLAWFYIYWKWPEHEIDHINGVRSDNRIANLRDVPENINKQNKRMSSSNNILGVLGVTPRYGKFQAQIKVNGRSKYLGLFESTELAHEAYLKAKRLYHPGCTI